MVEKQEIPKDKKLLQSLLDRQNTIQEIDTTFDPHNDAFDYIVAIEKDARKYVESLSISELRIALSRIVEKNPNILMGLMNNFAANFPGGQYRRSPFYDADKAKLPRIDRGERYSSHFRGHSTDDLFGSIDESMQKNHIDPQAILDIRKQMEKSYLMTQNDILKHIHQVFVDLLEEGYSREDLRA